MPTKFVFLCLGAPVTPTNVQVERFATGEFVVLWEEVENAVGYTLQVRF